VVLTRTPENVGQCFSTGVPQNMYWGSARVTGVGDRGATAPPKFLIWWKSGQNLWKFWQNLWNRSKNRCMCFDFTKMAPKSRCRHFFTFGSHVFILFFSGKLGEIWASSTMVLQLCF